MDYESEGWGFESLQAYQVYIRKKLGTVEVVSGNMPVACFLDSKERTEATAEGARGSAANVVRRKTEFLQAYHF